MIIGRRVRMLNPNSYLRILTSRLQNPKLNLPIYFTQNPTPPNRSVYNSAIQFILDEAQEVQSSKTQRNSSVQREEEISVQKKQPVLSNIEISHPWWEWVDLMEKLVKNGYFGEIGNPFENNGALGNKEANLIRSACLNFGRDNYHLIRHFSREDILAIAGSGCPSIDRKVVNSGKRLRAHVGLDEGNVCSSCILRGDCDRAYVKAREDEGGRTVDVMRLVLTYGLDPIVGSVQNKPCLNKRVNESVRMLLKEMVDIRFEKRDDEPPNAASNKWIPSAQENDVDQQKSRSDIPLKQGDWICPKCNFLNFARNIKCLRCNDFFAERLKKLAEEQADLPLKKGDWRCRKCNIVNFARNTKCFVCEEKPPKRPLNPGEWDCDSCNYINFRRNMVCLKCDRRRPIASNGADIASQPVSNSIQNHSMQAQYAQHKQNRFEGDDSMKYEKSGIQNHSMQAQYAQHKQNRLEGDDSMKYVKSVSEDRTKLSFMDFPVVGGKCDLSKDVKKQELWKMEMDAKCRTVVRARDDRRGDTGRHNSYIFGGASDHAAYDDDDDEDDLAEWFGD